MNHGEPDKLDAHDGLQPCVIPPFFCAIPAINGESGDMENWPKVAEEYQWQRNGTFT